MAGLIPANAERRGIYVLHFSDGMAYVGQTVNIWNRYTGHARTYRDIESLEFAPVPDSPGSPALDDVEQREIRRRSQERDLRNVRHYLPSAHRPNRLDAFVPPAHQLSFQDGNAVADIDGRVVTDEQREKGLKAFERFRTNPFAELAAFLAAEYIDATIPAPRATERRYWALSAAPSTNAGNRLFCFSINQPETFVLFDLGDMVHGFMNVSRTALADAYGSLDAFSSRFEEWIFVDDEAGYEACGGDAVRLRIDDEPNWCRVFEDPELDGVRDAARIMNLNLMRKGPTFQAKGHNVPLADVLLEEILAIGSDDDGCTAESVCDDQVPYPEFTGPLVTRPESEPTRAELVEALAEIVAFEGPVVGTRVHRAFARASGMTRLGARMRERLDAALSAAVRQGVLVQDAPLGERRIAERTYRLPDQPDVLVRPLGPREFIQVPPRELATVLAEVSGVGRADPDAIARETAAQYGISRLGAVVRARIELVRARLDVR